MARKPKPKPPLKGPAAPRKLPEGLEPEYVHGRWRTPPDSEDWTRRYLRDRHIPCEGDDLTTALDSLNSRQWAALKAAWRRRQWRRHGWIARVVNNAFKEGKRLGPIWQQLIAWDVISEADAVTLASPTTSSGFS